jgi:hypothetical protein
MFALRRGLLCYIAGTGYAKHPARARYTKSTVLFYVRISSNAAQRYNGVAEKPKVSRKIIIKNKIMKKILLVLFAFLGISLTNYASNYGTCTVKGGNGATVVVTVIDYDDDGTVYVSLSSDCDRNVNVTFTLSYTTYSRLSHSNSSPKTSQAFVYSVPANQDTPKTIQIRDSFGDNTILSKISDVNVSGARCE